MLKWSQHLVLVVVALIVSLNIANDAGEQRSLLDDQINTFNTIKSISSEVNEPRTLLGDVPTPALALYTGTINIGDLFEKDIDFIFPKSTYKNLSHHPLTAADLKGHGLAIFSRKIVRDSDIRVAETSGYITEHRDGLVVFKKQ